MMSDADCGSKFQFVIEAWKFHELVFGRVVGFILSRFSKGSAYFVEYFPRDYVFTWIHKLIV